MKVSPPDALPQQADSAAGSSLVTKVRDVAGTLRELIEHCKTAAGSSTGQGDVAPTILAAAEMCVPVHPCYRPFWSIVYACEGHAQGMCCGAYKCVCKLQAWLGMSGAHIAVHARSQADCCAPACTSLCSIPASALLPGWYCAVNAAASGAVACSHGLRIFLHCLGEQTSHSKKQAGQLWSSVAKSRYHQQHAIWDVLRMHLK